MNRKTALLKGLSIFMIIFMVTSLSGCMGSDRELPLNGFSDGGANPINYLLVYPMAYVMNFFGNLLGNSSLFAGIICLTVIVRLLSFPIYAGNMGSEVKQLKAKPELDALNRKYEGATDPQLQQQKMMEQFAINKKYGINPFKACLSLPFQLAIFSSMFDVLYRIKVPGGKLTLTNQKILGFDLNASFSMFKESVSNDLFIIVIVLLTALTTFLFTRLTTANMNKAMSQTQPGANDAMANQMGQMMKYFILLQPLMIGYFAFGNSAMGIYYIVGNICSIIQFFVMKKINDKKMKDYLASIENGVVEVL